MFLDPHRDSWPRAAPFLAHDPLMQRIALIDLNTAGPTPLLSSWNPLAMQHGPPPHDVIEAVTDAFASVLGWDDASAPRAITILTACLTVLVTVNQAACHAGRPRTRPPSSTSRRSWAMPPSARPPHRRVRPAQRGDPRMVADRLPTLPSDAFAVVLNPLARLAAHPVTRAFLGQPTGIYNSRAAWTAD